MVQHKVIYCKRVKTELWLGKKGFLGYAGSYSCFWIEVLLLCEQEGTNRRCKQSLEFPSLAVKGECLYMHIYTHALFKVGPRIQDNQKDITVMLYVVFYHQSETYLGVMIFFFIHYYILPISPQVWKMNGNTMKSQLGKINPPALQLSHYFWERI